MQNVAKFIKTILLVLSVLTSAIWAVLAIYLGDSAQNHLQTVLAGLFAVLALLTLIKRTQYFLISYVFIFIGVLISWLVMVQPSNQRHWQTDVAQLPYASINGDLVTVYNIRNFSYRSEFDYIPAYYNKTYNLNELNSVDLFAVYWMGDAIAHVMLSFNFANKDYLAVSIEARKEQNESYSTFKGFFRQYELIYIVADERDVVGLRSHYRHNPTEQVYLYRLKPNQTASRQLFLQYVKEMNQLHEKPKFYNTLLDNCTTTIWLNSLVNQQHLAFSWKILLSGYVPEYLYESGRLASDLSFSKLKQQAYLNPEQIPLSTNFSRLIRSKQSVSSKNPVIPVIH